MPAPNSLRSRLFPSQIDVRTLIVYNVLQGLYMGYINVFWQPYLVSLGVAVATIGLLEGLSGRSGLLASAIQVFGGRLSDTLGRKRLALAGSGLLVSCWTAAAFVLMLRRPALVPLPYVLWSLSAASLPVLDAVLADNIPSQDRPRTYSVVMAANTVPGAATGYLAGTVLYGFGPVPLLAAAALLEASGFLLIARRLASRREPRLEQEAEREAQRLRGVLSNAKAHWKLFSAFTVDSVAWSIGVSLLYALLRADKAYGPSEFAQIGALFPLGMIAGTIPGGWLTHRIGAKKLLYASEIMGCAVWLGWGLYPERPLAPLYAFVWGMAVTTWVPVQFYVTTAAFPEESRGELLGALATFRGLIASLGPLVATALYLRFGYPAPFVASAASIVVAIGFIAAFIPDVKEPQANQTRGA